MEETEKNLQPEMANAENTNIDPQPANTIVPDSEQQSVAETPADEQQQPTQAAETPADSQSEQQPEQPFVEPQTDYSAYSREQLVEALRELLQLDITQIRNRVLAIKQQFAEKNKQYLSQQQEQQNQPDENADEQKNTPNPDTVTETYNELYSQYRKKRQQYNQQLDAQKQHNMELKNQLLDELRQLINSTDTLKASHDKFNNIQERWKTIGDVPRNEINNLWNNYHFLIEQFFTKVKITKELRDKDLKANLDKKIAICEKTEALIMEPSVNKAFKELQQYREQWRGIGPAPSEQNEEIWSRFCNAAEKIDQRRREHYSHMQEEMEQNLLAKTELCQKAETLAETQCNTIKEWNDKSNEMDELMKIWRSIGPVPREHNETIWQRFTATMSKFHQNKNQYLSQLRSEQSENYNRKVDICIKAENLAENTDNDWRKATDQLLALQNEWKSIGSVPKKQSEKVWQRFRAACDKFFERKTEFYNSRKDAGQENIQKRQQLIDEMKNLQFTDDNKQNLAAIQALQRRWNEVGFTPGEKRSQLQHEFNNVVNAHFDKLKITVTDMAAADQTDLSPEATRRLHDEIEKLKAEVATWENNIGFFANSKQADLLKQEFDKKIHSAHQRIALLEAKLKMASKKNNKTEKNSEAESSQ